MSNLYRLTDEQMARLARHFPKNHGGPRVGDRRDIFQSAPHSIEPCRKKGDAGRMIGRTKGGMHSKLHAVTDANGRPISFFMTAGQVSDFTGAAALLGKLPRAQWLLADRGYDADWFRHALPDKAPLESLVANPGIGAIKHYKRRYERCPNAFFSTIALAATVIFWF